MVRVVEGSCTILVYVTHVQSTHMFSGLVDLLLKEFHSVSPRSRTWDVVGERSAVLPETVSPWPTWPQLVKK